MVFRIYVEKKPGFDIEARHLTAELQHILGIDGLKNVRVINRYDVETNDKALFEQSIPLVFSEPQSDNVYFELPQSEEHIFAVEFLPGQFDQRASSAAECMQLISQAERNNVSSAKVYCLQGDLTEEDIATIKDYVINPVEAREASLDTRTTLVTECATPAPVQRIAGFRELDQEGLISFIKEFGLAMDLADISFTQKYFIEENRDPSITEIKVIDTYWSDHCRHTTFGTELTKVEIDDKIVQEAFDTYLDLRKENNREHKPICFMDLGTIGARTLKARGILTKLDESEEINACTVKTTVDVDGVDQDWLFLFKNETHNHPTEVEPFGGAATCIGGCIRDPLSGRSYVYQAMRLTGAANPLAPVQDTMPGKLPQRKIVTTAAQGYSSYGNQIGLATGQVDELYHPGYAAKRMEIGAVVGATPADHVRRETPDPGDVILLLGGRTGRDGIGGATGSSKAHDESSLESCGAEVQKGNAPVERNLQRLFRRKDATQMIKRCNDFGAGGVSVAVGEIADGLKINLDRVPKKYAGLDGTELALSESQERMAVDIAASDVEAFIAIAESENVEATPIAEVTAEPRVRMTWQNDDIVDLSRAFLASNGAPKEAEVHIKAAEKYEVPADWKAPSITDRFTAVVTDLNVSSNKGLAERFDSTIGASTVLMPFGGKNQLTPALAMAAKLPVQGKTSTMSGMAWGYNPYISSADQYRGAYLAVVESVSKLIASGFKRKNTYLTFQEYFGSLLNDPARWGKPAGSLLGALMAQLDLEVGSIGGKDSMSGSFEDLDVPPTLVSFAVALDKITKATSPEFKGIKHKICRISPTYEREHLLPEKESLLATFNVIEELIDTESVCAVSTCGYGCGAEALFKMAVGNSIGLSFATSFDDTTLFEPAYGTFFVELNEDAKLPSLPEGVKLEIIAITTEEYSFEFASEKIDLRGLQEAWESKLEEVYPYRQKGSELEKISYNEKLPLVSSTSFAHPRVVIPVFPGTNCEFDTAAAFKRAGAIPSTFIINTMSPEAIANSVHKLATLINESQIIALPGGFSGGDEPDGSAKFITALFRAPEITDAVRELLNNRDGLMLGICNGFQALIKLGLVPYGDIRQMDDTCPTLTFNNIGRHQSGLVRTRVASTLSPWLSHCNVDDIHTVAISHGEGRLVANDEILQTMIAQGQIATQYVDQNDNPTSDLQFNPNGSVLAIEGITSPDGRIFGKMGHTERWTEGVYQNIPNRIYQPIIEGGVDYFKG